MLVFSKQYNQIRNICRKLDNSVKRMLNPTTSQPEYFIVIFDSFLFISFSMCTSCLHDVAFNNVLYFLCLMLLLKQ